MATQSTSSMPVLIRSNTTSLLDRASTLEHRSSPMDHKSTPLDQRDHRTITLDHRSSNMDHRNNMMEQRTSTMDHRTSTLDHRTSTIDQRDHRPGTMDQRDHRTSTLDQRSKTMDRGCGMKDGQSRKLSMWVAEMFCDLIEPITGAYMNQHLLRPSLPESLQQRINMVAQYFNPLEQTQTWCFELLKLSKTIS